MGADAVLEEVRPLPAVARRRRAGRPGGPARTPQRAGRGGRCASPRRAARGTGRRPRDRSLVVRARHRLERDLDRGELFGRGPLGRESRHGGFDDPANLEHAAQELGIEAGFGQPGEHVRVEESPIRPRQDHGPALGSRLDQAFRGEDLGASRTPCGSRRACGSARLAREGSRLRRALRGRSVGRCPGRRRRGSRPAVGRSRRRRSVALNNHWDGTSAHGRCGAPPALHGRAPACSNRRSGGIQSVTVRREPGPIRGAPADRVGRGVPRQPHSPLCSAEWSQLRFRRGSQCRR